MLKVIIAGGRNFNYHKLLCVVCDAILYEHRDKGIEIVSGGAKGADLRGAVYAHDRGYAIKEFQVTKREWNELGKSAGPIRNEKMAKYADMLIAFWDGESPGTKKMIKQAKQQELSVYVCEYKKYLSENK